MIFEEDFNKTTLCDILCETKALLLVKLVVGGAKDDGDTSRALRYRTKMNLLPFCLPFFVAQKYKDE
jgi:hypothetical protein